ncbi:SRPBCC family protein [Albidovulum sp.]
MKFSTREDIEVPVELVFGAVTDFSAFERAAMRRGAEVVRIDRHGPDGPRHNWTIRFPLRGKMRRVNCSLVEYDPPRGLLVDAGSSGFDGMLRVSLLALSRQRTRLGVELEIRPRNLSSRMLLQAIRIGKPRYARRFRARVKAYTTELELRHRARGAV